MKTAQEIITTVQSRLRADSSEFWSDQDLVDAYNDALDEIADATEIREIWVPMKRKKWATYTDMRGVLPTVALRVTGIWNPIADKWLDPTTPRELDNSVGRGWEEIVDTARWWFMRGMWHLGVFPVAGDDLSPLRVYCSALFPHVSLTGGLSTGLGVRAEVLPAAETAIENYMLSTMLSDRGETQKAISYWQDYQVGEKGLKEAHEFRMQRDRTPRMGARR